MAQGSAGVTSQHGTVEKKKKRKAPPSASNGVGSAQEKVGRSHIQIHRKEEKKNPHQDLCPNGSHYCNYKAQISDQALR